ncbi:MAG TPA: anti-sigma factor [Thermomicrobiales bacterium]|nr:anti-sigma factor [Thermomicrobiales bacterium]
MARDKRRDQRPNAQSNEADEQLPVSVTNTPEAPVPPAETTGEETSDAPHDAVGAYLLDALPDDERIAFEAHLAECPACQDEVRELAPVVQVLPRVLELDPQPAITGDPVEIPEPASDLRTRILAAVRDEQSNVGTSLEPTQDGAFAPALDAQQPESAVAIAPVPAPTRPPGRVRPGVARGRSTTSDASFWQSVSRLDRGWLAAAALAIVAVGAIIWALALQGQVGDLKGEIRAQNDEIAQLRGSANATAALLGPTADGPSQASGTLYYSLQADQPPVLALQGMTPLSNNRVYQLWYIKGDAAPVPGPTFTVNDAGAAAVPVASDVPTYTNVAVTAEPNGGSKTPTAPILMTGQLSGARG